MAESIAQVALAIGLVWLGLSLLAIAFSIWLRRKPKPDGICRCCGKRPMERASNFCTCCNTPPQSVDRIV